MERDFQSLVESVKNVERSMNEQKKKHQRELQLKEEELNQKHNMVQETLREQPENNQELQEEVCRLQRESEEKSQREKELHQELRELQNTIKFKEKIEAKNQNEKEQMRKIWTRKKGEQKARHIFRTAETRTQGKELDIEEGFAVADEGSRDVVKDVERRIKEKTKQLQRELELKEEEKQQLERKNAELEKTIRGETSPNQTETENHQSQRRQ
ncbi:hypothetical protein WMY93_017750 [Mugilogobius chulae]|uniref:BMERB domain-containing protein n=1 Tax=Mugilogobius chulae TaxID=88201 RepID=A0AAW0NQA0_9GOBI